MEGKLTKALQGIHMSSQTIFKNNQRHLYCNALDLLANSWNTSKDANVETINDEIMQLLQNVIELVFDKDQSIQNSAIIALENGISTFGVAAIHQSDVWGKMRNAIVTNYVQQIHKLRNESNRHWSKIWCLLIRLLENDILKGASTINTFLSIVELGFRSSDNLIRAESFTCWRLLIKIFTTYNEISSAKRMKLIAIPLKSSHTKSMHTAEVKLRVWWYLLTCLKDSIASYIQLVIEPFLEFCFGPSTKTPAAAAQYPIVRQLALPCLVTILSTNQNEFMEQCLKGMKLEHFALPSPLVADTFLREHWRLILNTTCEAMRLYTMGENEDLSENEYKMFEMLLMRLFEIMLKLNCPEFNTQLCGAIKRLIPQNARLVLFAINTLSGNEFGRLGSIDNYTCIEPLASLVFAAKDVVPQNVAVGALKNIYSLKNLHSFVNDPQCLPLCLKSLSQSPSDDDCMALLKSHIWQAVTNALTTDSKKTNSSCGEEMKHWIIWPLSNVKQTRKIATLSSGDKEIVRSWQKIFSAMLQPHESCFSQSELVCDVNKGLRERISLETYESYTVLFIEAYVHAITSMIRKCDCKIISDLISLLIRFHEYMTRMKAEVHINTLKEVLLELTACQIEDHFSEIENLLTCVISSSGSDSEILQTLKRALLEKVRLHSNKNILLNLKNIFKEKDSYVIIPSVWSLNPEKLTERQKERMAEKSLIPALYNDMSQSQDNQIQPWTPSKIIIPGEKSNQFQICPPPELRTADVPSTGESSSGVHDRTQKVLPKSKLSSNPSDNSLGNREGNLEFLHMPSQLKDDADVSRSRNLMESVVKCGTINNANEVSPRKCTLRPTLLSSPPDRKLTNNSASPTVKSKPSTGNLTGRGAQLINMIRNKRVDTQSPQVLKTNSFNQKFDLIEEKSCLDQTETNGNENSDARNLLVFSKRLPSPTASPSASILKRKMCLENIDDLCTESPAAKRKRVSFHDPPVSTTKAYIKEVEENKHKPKSNRCLVLDKVSTKLGSESKYSLKRKSKLDSLHEIEKFSSESKSELVSDGVDVTREHQDMSESLNLHVDNDDPKTPDLTAIEPEVILQYVACNFSLNSVLEKYFSQCSDSMQNAILVAKCLSNLMINPRIKSNVFEILSENHSKDFLDHAIQENLSSVVCDRLNLNSVIDFIFAKSVINTNCRINLVSQLMELIEKNKSEDESLLFIEKLLKKCNLSNDATLKLISILVNKNSLAQDSAINVSESAVDSSSNL